MATKTLTAAEAQVRAVLDDWAEAVRAKDADRVVSHYAPDIVAYDLAPPLQFRGAETLRKGLVDWFQTWTGPIGFEVRDPFLVAGGDLAVVRSLNRIFGRRTNGEDTDVWVRATACLRKIGGRWKVIHDHVSVPFYMDGSFRAAIDLKP
jgi:uncharacterized protein (TIGR02246 family)